MFRLNENTEKSFISHQGDNSMCDPATPEDAHTNFQFHPLRTRDVTFRNGLHLAALSVGTVNFNLEITSLLHLAISEVISAAKSSDIDVFVPFLGCKTSA